MFEPENLKRATRALNKAKPRAGEPILAGPSPAALQSADLMSALGTDGVVQMRRAPSLHGESAAVGQSNELRAHLQSAGAGCPLPLDVQSQMAQALGTDVSDVRIHEGPQAQALGAAAFASGNHIHFAPGEYDPRSQSGSRLLGHELSHVVQQREGRVRPTGRVDAVPINDDTALEAEADRLGALATASREARPRSNSTRAPKPAATTSSAIQCAPPTDKQVATLLKELDKEIAATDWPVFRLTVLNQYDKPLLEKVKKRKGTKTEMTGIGAKLVVGQFVTSFKAIQTKLSKGGKKGLPKLQDIADEYLKAANTALKAVKVEPLRQAVVTQKTIQASFTASDWSMNLNPDYMRPTFNAKDDVDEAYSLKMAKTVFHESRHCEQRFRVGRWLVGDKQQTAADLENDGMHSDAAKAAEALPLTTKSGTPEEIAEAKGWVASFAIGQAKTEPARKAVKKLAAFRKDCIAARDELKKKSSQTHYDKAKKACIALVKHKTTIPPAYKQYLALAHEKSAREAGYEVEVLF